MSIPTITIVGNLTDDPKTGTGRSGKEWCNFTVIAQSRRQDQQGNWVDGDKCPLRVACFGRLARNAAMSLSKGTTVIVQGRLRQTQYQAQDGSTRYSYDMTADHVGAELTFASAQVTRNTKGGGVRTAAAPAANPWTGNVPTDPWGDVGTDDGTDF